MSTFGGVALAGDVNVNAIAPGIAAALLATIAGLAAAIPSLFGYNYLNSRITTEADEMRVFIDRLITRLAEMQADAAYASNPPSLEAAE
jgi:biopolymer transport protein ExbB